MFTKARDVYPLPEEPPSVSQDFMNPAEEHLKRLLLSPAGWLAATSCVTLWLMPIFMAFLFLSPIRSNRFLLPTKVAGSSSRCGGCSMFACSDTDDKRQREAGNHHPCVGQPLALLSHQFHSRIHFLHNSIQTSSLCPRGKFNINVFATLNYHHTGQWAWNSIQTKHLQNCGYRRSFSYVNSLT